MKKHISEVELWRQGFTPDEDYQGDEPPYHKDEFCLLCGYFMEGDRLYLEIHGSNGAINRIKDIDSSQPYVGMECVFWFQAQILEPGYNHTNRTEFDRRGITNKELRNFIKEKKK